MADAVAPGGFGGVEGFVGDLDEVFGGLLPAEGGGDADADGGGVDGRSLAGDLSGLDCCSKLFGDAPGLAGGGLRKDDEELLSAVSSDASGVGDDVGDDAAKLFEHGVSGAVAEGVVDGFEVVDVDQEDGEGGVVLAGVLALRVEKGHDVTAVEELGDGVDDGGMFEIGDLREVFGGVECEGANGEDEDGCGEEDEADDPVFVVVWAVGGVDAEEDGDAGGGEGEECSHSAPGGTGAATGQHGADPADGEEG